MCLWGNLQRKHPKRVENNYLHSQAGIGSHRCSHQSHREARKLRDTLGCNIPHLVRLWFSHRWSNWPVFLLIRKWWHNKVFGNTNMYIDRKIPTFSKAHLLPYVFPSEPHTGENSFVHAFGQPSGYKIYLSQIIKQDQHKPTLIVNVTQYFEQSTNQICLYVKRCAACA